MCDVAGFPDLATAVFLFPGKSFVVVMRYDTYLGKYEKGYARAHTRLSAFEAK